MFMSPSELKNIFGVNEDTVMDWLQFDVFSGRFYGGVYKVKTLDVVRVLAIGNALFNSYPKNEWPRLVKEYRSGRGEQLSENARNG